MNTEHSKKSDSLDDEGQVFDRGNKRFINYFSIFPTTVSRWVTQPDAKFNECDIDFLLTRAGTGVVKNEARDGKIEVATEEEVTIALNMMMIK